MAMTRLKLSDGQITRVNGELRTFSIPDLAIGERGFGGERGMATVQKKVSEMLR